MIPQTRIVIENVTPALDAGRFAVKGILGDRVAVEADIWKDGHELLKAVVLWRKLPGAELHPHAPAPKPRVDLAWQEAAMTTAFESNDRWFASFAPKEIGAHAFTVLAWTDLFGTWRSEFKKKQTAGQDLEIEIAEGIELVTRTGAGKKGSADGRLAELVKDLCAAPLERQVTILLATGTSDLMTECDLRADAQAYAAELPLWIDRERARFGSWYEIFPRSQGTTPGRHATLREAEQRLPAIAAMGFDVLYLTPIHPIGHTARRGPDNSDVCGASDPGSPWAIGSEAGGHTAVHEELGTLDDFDHFVTTAQNEGLELALDFAVQCSPDHPWVKEHPEWFQVRPDGSIRYAENPPKKYKDIFPLNFETTDREGLYGALLDAVLFWVGHGVRIFRVDNPHTKAVSFWEWLITMVHREHPDVLFLAEAFTRPKRMKMLAKVGFTQSYTYFTWRNTRAELEEYATELFLTDLHTCLRPNFFVNTPDILHEFLQTGGRPAFIARLVLAATLSPTYGIYSGFELCEREPQKEGSEEYLHSEKFEVRVRDWATPDSLAPLIARLNSIRREYRSLQLGSTLHLLESTNPYLIAYAKMLTDDQSPLVTVVNLDPFHVHEGTIRVPVDLFEPDEYRVTDLLAERTYEWRSEWNYVRLDPQQMPAHVLRLST